MGEKKNVGGASFFRRRKTIEEEDNTTSASEKKRREEEKGGIFEMGQFGNFCWWAQQKQILYIFCVVSSECGCA